MIAVCTEVSSGGLQTRGACGVIGRLFALPQHACVWYSMYHVPGRMVWNPVDAESTHIPIYITKCTHVRTTSVNEKVREHQACYRD